MWTDPYLFTFQSIEYEQSALIRIKMKQLAEENMSTNILRPNKCRKQMCKSENQFRAANLVFV